MDLVIRSLVTLARSILMEQMEWRSGSIWSRVENRNEVSREEGFFGALGKRNSTFSELEGSLGVHIWIRGNGCRVEETSDSLDLW